MFVCVMRSCIDCLVDNYNSNVVYKAFISDGIFFCCRGLSLLLRQLTKCGQSHKGTVHGESPGE